MEKFIKFSKIVIAVFLICFAAVLVVTIGAGEEEEIELFGLLVIALMVSAVCSLFVILVLFLFEMREGIREDAKSTIWKVAGEIIFLCVLFNIFDYFFLHNELRILQSFLTATAVTMGSYAFKYMGRYHDKK